jgi:hypothetical protein
MPNVSISVMKTSYLLYLGARFKGMFSPAYNPLNEVT